MQRRGTPVFTFSKVGVVLSSTMPIFSFRVMSASTWLASWTGRKRRASCAVVHGHDVALAWLPPERPPCAFAAAVPGRARPGRATLTDNTAGKTSQLHRTRRRAPVARTVVDDTPEQ